ncbi:MAG: carboxymuconolactone decarboxylase family protein [Methylocella sp.]
MARVNLIDPAAATGEAKLLLEQIKGAFGTAPNMFRAVANSPAALKSMWAAFGALGAGTIGAKLGEKIAVAVADRDACSYCLAAHTLLGKNAGASGQEMADAQAGHSGDPKTAAALAFALKLVEQRGQVADADIAAVRGGLRRRSNRRDYRPCRAQPVHQLRQRRARRSAGLPKREVPPRCATSEGPGRIAAPDIGAAASAPAFRQ